MTIENKVIENATVVIQDKKVVSINNSVPGKAKIIEGGGKWLVPGFIDMHIHNLADISFNPDYYTKGAMLFTDTQDIMLLFVANGVTTVFELSERVKHFGKRNEMLAALAKRNDAQENKYDWKKEQSFDIALRLTGILTVSGNSNSTHHQ